MDYYAIGQRIRKARKARGLSQEELAAMTGISTTHMSHIETGNTKLSLPVMVDLASRAGRPHGRPAFWAGTGKAWGCSRRH